MKSTEWRAEKTSAHSARRIIGRPGFRCAASGLHTANRLTQVVKGAITQTQSYNGLGQRVKKSVTQNGNTVSTLYAYDESGQLIGEYNGSGTALTEVVYLDGQPVLAIKGSSVYGI